MSTEYEQPAEQIIDDLPIEEPQVPQQEFLTEPPKEEEVGEPQLDTPAAEEEPQAPAYEPDYSYTIKSKQFEFDDRLRDVIKDKESEDYVRDLVTRAEGLESYKSRVSERDAELSSLRDQHSEIQGSAEKYKVGFERLNGLAQSDLSSFQKAWGVSDQAIVDLARNIVQQDENPQIASQRQTQFNSVVQGWQHQDQMSQHQSQQSNESQRLHDLEMQIATQAPEAASFQQAFDQARGKEGAFKEMVDTYGSAEFARGNYVKPQDSVKAIMEQWKGVITPQQQIQGQPNLQQMTQSVQPQAAPQRTANPLPNMGSGRTGSPVKKKMSWADLKQQAGLK